MTVSSRPLRRSPAELSRESFDLLIIGGGVNGLATAWDAALRGLRVALVEQGDFGSASSAGSLKIIHGGLRYLQKGDLTQVRESVGERRHLSRMAPHLIEPLPFLVPTYRGCKPTQWRSAMRVALGLNDLLSFDRNRGVPAWRNVPRGRTISAEGCRRMAPMVREEGLTGGAIFYDGQMRNADRVTLSFARSAVDAGAVLANYCRVDRLVREGDRIVAAEGTDVETGDPFEVKADCFVDMTGPWVDLLAPTVGGQPAGREVVKSAGLQIATPPLFPERIGFAARGDGRMFFATPWRGMTLWGTTDTTYRGDPAAWRITETDVQRFVDDLNQVVPALGLQRDQVLHAFGGLRPVDPKRVEAGARLERMALRTDHAQTHGIRNWLSVEGFKYTTARLTAEQTVDAACMKLGFDRAGTYPTREAVLWGGDLPDLANAEQQAAKGLGDDAIARHLVGAYGSRWADVATGPVHRIGDSTVTEEEVRHAVRHEAALHLDDVVLRRTELGTLGRPTDAVLQAVCDCMGRELGWGPDRMAAEMARVGDAFDLG